MSAIQVFKLYPDNFDECKTTLKHIFWMYHDLVRNNGFVHNIDYEEIDYKKFLFSEIEAESMVLFQKEIEILKQGSLIALCCEVVNLLDEEKRSKEVLNFISEANEYSQIIGLTYIESLLTSMRLALEEELPNPDPSTDWTALEYGEILSNMLQQIYSQFVLGYYRSSIEK